MAGGTPDSTDTRFEDQNIRICVNVAYNNITLSLLKRFLAVIYNIIC